VYQDDTVEKLCGTGILLALGANILFGLSKILFGFAPKQSENGTERFSGTGKRRLKKEADKYLRLKKEPDTVFFAIRVSRTRPSVTVSMTMSHGG